MTVEELNEELDEAISNLSLEDAIEFVENHSAFAQAVLAGLRDDEKQQ